MLVSSFGPLLFTYCIYVCVQCLCIVYAILINTMYIIYISNIFKYVSNDKQILLKNTLNRNFSSRKEKMVSKQGNSQEFLQGGVRVRVTAPPTPQFLMGSDQTSIAGGHSIPATSCAATSAPSPKSRSSVLMLPSPPLSRKAAK